MRQGGKQVGDHRNDEAIVELTRVPTQIEANAIIAELAGKKIKAMSGSDDAGGWRPQLTYTNGVRVLVFEDDLEAAQRVLRDLSLPEQ